MRTPAGHRLEPAQGLAPGPGRLRGACGDRLCRSTSTGSSRSSSSSACSSPGPPTGTPTGSRSGWSARGSFPLGEDPALHGTVERLAVAAGVRSLASSSCPTGTRGLAPPAAAAGARDRGQPRAPRRRHAGRARRRRRARARPRPQPRHPRPDAGGRGCRSAARHSAVSAAGSHGRCSSCSVRWPPRSCISCSRREREFAADRAAAALTGSPHGLADALIRLEQAAELVEFRAEPATEPLYTFNPFAEEGLAALFVTHPPVGERVRRLRELDPPGGTSSARPRTANGRSRGRLRPRLVGQI